jgi:hypothetical protein
MSNLHGGSRPGAGKKLGTKWPSTLAKEQVRELVRQAVTEHMADMIDAQIAQAKGIRHLVVRDADGKFSRVPDTITPEAMDALMANGGVVIEVWTKDPSTQAFTDLMNRAIDKPKEQEQALRVGGISETTLAILDRWKLRNRRSASARRPKTRRNRTDGGETALTVAGLLYVGVRLRRLSSPPG